MNVLAFDCSTTGCSAAVVASGRLLAARTAPPGSGQAEALLPLIAATMAESGLGWDRIAVIGVTVGPGSFTGLRIGLAAARGLALAGGIAVAGVTTAEVFAHAVPADQRRGRTVLVAVDGKRSDIFVQPFAEDLTPLAAVAALTPDQAAGLVDGPVLVTGDAAERLAGLLTDMIISGGGPPDAVVVAGLAAARLAGGRALPPVPLYLRPPDVTLPPIAPM